MSFSPSFLYMSFVDSVVDKIITKCPKNKEEVQISRDLAQLRTGLKEAFSDTWKDGLC